MVSRCANPDCGKPFLYMREGKLFHIDTSQHPELRRKPPDAKRSEDIEHFWLCGNCSREFTVAYVPGEGITAVPLSRLPRAA